MDIQTINVGSARVRYADAGTGQALVLLHGFSLTLEVFERIIPELSRSFRVIAVDLPGHGGSLPIPGMHFLPETAHWLRSFLLKIDVHDCVLAGHSLGGYIAMAFAEKYPEYLSGLCMFHSIAAADLQSRKELRDRVVDFIERNGKDAYIKNFIPGIFFKKDPAVIQSTYTRALQTRKEAMAAYNQAMRDRINRVPVLEKLDIPILYLLGDRDEFISLARAREEVLRTKHGATVVLPQVGHAGMYESTSQCVRELKNLMVRSKKME